jgi:predicted nucleic acid-binding protein
VIIANINLNDNHHEQVVSLSKYLVEKNIEVVYPVTVIAEANAYIQRVLNNNLVAYETVKIFTKPGVLVAEIDQDILREATRFFDPNSSKKNMLFDCIVAAVAQKYETEVIFSFDKFYKSCGFGLLSESTKMGV